MNTMNTMSITKTMKLMEIMENTMIMEMIQIESHSPRTNPQTSVSWFSYPS